MESLWAGQIPALVCKMDVDACLWGSDGDARLPGVGAELPHDSHEPPREAHEAKRVLSRAGADGAGELNR